MTHNEFDKIVDKYLKGIASEKDIQTLHEFEYFAEKCVESKNLLGENQDIKDTILASINHRHKANKFSILKYAAILILAISIGFFGYQSIFNNNQNIKLVNLTSDTKTFELVDGTMVTLRQNSEITYSENDFNQDDRQVKLVGRAYFNVSKDKSKPFIIKTNNLTTKVLGTEFSIDESLKSTKVTVSEGLVQVYSSKDTLKVHPNQQVVFSKDTESLNTNIVNAQIFNYWSQEKITLENITLEELENILKDLFTEVDFSYTNTDLKNSRLSLTFKRNDDLKDIIEIINLISDLNLTLTEENIINVK